VAACFAPCGSDGPAHALSEQNVLSPDDVAALAVLADMDPVKSERRLLMPVSLFGLDVWSTVSSASCLSSGNCRFVTMLSAGRCVLPMMT
jgi:hypothetical protein